jgi:hypothetical protein
MVIRFTLLLAFVFCVLGANEKNIENTRKYIKTFSDKSTSHMQKSWDKDNEILEGILKERSDAADKSGREFYKDLLKIEDYKKEEE